MQKKISLQFIFFVLICFFIGGIAISIDNIYNFEDGMLITQTEIQNASKLSYRDFLSTNYDSLSVQVNSGVDHSIVKSKIDLNLFGFLKIKTINVNIVNTNLFLGGNTVGIFLENKGVTIVGFGGVKIGNEVVYPLDGSGMQIGDVLTKINDTYIASSKDIDYFLSNNYKGEELKLEYISSGVTNYVNLSPIFDTSTNSYRLGLWVRENTTGIGTLTYVTKNNRFGALGHGLSENGQIETMNISSGSLYECNVLGITKGKRGDAGEIRAMFKPNSVEQGVVDKNNDYGVFGYVNQNSIYKNQIEFEAGGRLSVKPGKAYIYCQLNDNAINKYEVEIIKTNYQAKSNQKSMIIKIVDKNLIDKTGGIIQGMSGSPIVQDNKIVGAVTHVFVNDPTKGFGVYLDWMLEQ